MERYQRKLLSKKALIFELSFLYSISKPSFLTESRPGDYWTWSEENSDRSSVLQKQLCQPCRWNAPLMQLRRGMKLKKCKTKDKDEQGLLVVSSSPVLLHHYTRAKNLQQTNNNKQSIQYAQLLDVLLRRFVLRASIWVTYCKVPASSFGPAAWSAFYKDAEEQGRKGDNGDNAIKDSIRPDAASADMPNVGTNATECAQNATSPSSKFWWQIAKWSQLLPCPDMNQTAQPRNRCPYPGQTKTSSTRPCCPSDIATLQQLAGLQGLQAGSDDARLSWLLWNSNLSILQLTVCHTLSQVISSLPEMPEEWWLAHRPCCLCMRKIQMPCRVWTVYNCQRWEWEEDTPESIPFSQLHPQNREQIQWSRRRDLTEWFLGTSYWKLKKRMLKGGTPCLLTSPPKSPDHHRTFWRSTS